MKQGGQFLLMSRITPVFARYTLTIGAVVEWLSERTQNAGVVRLNSPCVTIKTALVRKAMGNHLIKLAFLEKAQSPVSGFCYARDRIRNAIPIDCWMDR